MYSIITAAIFASSALAMPTGGACPNNNPPASDSCASKSSNFGEWTVKDFDFHKSYIFTNPAHQNSQGDVNFTLSNAAAGTDIVCSATSFQLDLFFYGWTIRKCTGADGKLTDDATFTYNDANRELMINQTWSCGGDGGKYFAQGGVKLDLDCKETKYQNPDWKGGLGEDYSRDITTCDKVTVAAKATKVQKLN